MEFRALLALVGFDGVGLSVVEDETSSLVIRVVLVCSTGVP